MKNKKVKDTLIVIVVSLLVLLLVPSAKASTPTVTPTVTVTQGAYQSPTSTPTVTPTIPVAVNKWFETNMKDIMRHDLIYRDDCGNITFIQTGVVPKEYYQMYKKRNIIYNFLRVKRGMTNQQILNALQTKDDFEKLYLILKRKGIV